MDRVNGRPCYCSIGAGGTPCIDRKYCDALREIERLHTALERNTQEIHRYKHIDRGHHCGWRVIAEAMIARSREALQEGES